MAKRRVVVTGLGMVTPLGLTVEESWQAMLAGKNGIAPITHMDVTDYYCTIAAMVKPRIASNEISRWFKVLFVI